MRSLTVCFLEENSGRCGELKDTSDLTDVNDNTVDALLDLPCRMILSPLGPACCFHTSLSYITREA